MNHMTKETKKAIRIIALVIAFLLVLLSISYVLHIEKNLDEFYTDANVNELIISLDPNLTVSENMIKSDLKRFYICGSMETEDQNIPSLGIYIYRQENNEFIYDTEIPFSPGNFCKEIVMDWENLIGKYYVNVYFFRPLEGSLNFEIINP